MNVSVCFFLYLGQHFVYDVTIDIESEIVFRYTVDSILNGKGGQSALR